MQQFDLGSLISIQLSIGSEAGLLQTPLRASSVNSGPIRKQEEEEAKQVFNLKGLFQGFTAQKQVNKLTSCIGPL